MTVHAAGDYGDAGGDGMVWGDDACERGERWGLWMWGVGGEYGSFGRVETWWIKNWSWDFEEEEEKCWEKEDV